MSIKQIVVRTFGVTFPSASQWHTDQRELMDNLENQIIIAFPNSNNVLVNLTWFGPQFPNDEWSKFTEYCHYVDVDNLFLLASEDPCFFNREQTGQFNEYARHVHLLGHFESPYTFNFFAGVLPKYFKQYAEEELHMQKPLYTFLNYNRKPREHRTKLVRMLDAKGLTKQGIATLGDDRNLGETIEEIGPENQWWPDEYGIPHDIHSLGRMEIWNQHFLTLVSETDYEDFLWTYVTEKTFKPIIGMRPFVINGQAAVYKWLTDRGFRTFNRYWDHINLETCDIHDIHPNICSVIEYLNTQDLTKMYKEMLPDLQYNRQRFFEYAREQQKTMRNLFC